MREAIRHLLLRESHARPLLVLVEDLHWIDSETQATLDRLVESLPTAHLLLIGTHRPEYRPPWAGRTYYSQLRLDPLASEHAQLLLRSLLGAGIELAPLAERVIERTEGNPFFLEESVRSLVETQAVVGEAGDYRLAQVVRDIEVPPAVEALLAARIDRLSPDDRHVLQSAAAIGTDVPLALLAAMQDSTEDVLGPSVARLQAAEFLYEKSGATEAEYTFKHALTHEVAYGSLPGERRRALHARIVDALEARHPDQLERLGHHALRGEIWDKAVTYLRQAGEKAAARSAYREAAAAFEQALAALGHLPESRGTIEQSIDLRPSYASASAAHGSRSNPASSPARRGPGRVAGRSGFGSAGCSAACATPGTLGGTTTAPSRSPPAPSSSGTPSVTPSSKSRRRSGWAPFTTPLATTRWPPAS